MTEKIKNVFEYLQEKIADLKDVNRHHIKIKSVSDAIKKDFVSTRTIIFSIDNGEEQTAFWNEYEEQNGKKNDFIKLT